MPEKKTKRCNNWGEYIYWVYANMNMFCAAANREMEKYDKMCFGIRAKMYKKYREGTYKIHSLYENNNWKMNWGMDECWYCGRPVSECGKLSADHIFPRAKGGDDSFDNIAYACKSCNSSKGAKDLIQWFADDMDYWWPPFHIVCIYMKLVYQHSVANNLMECSWDEICAKDLPFNPRSLIFIENMMKTAFDKREDEQEIN